MGVTLFLLLEANRLVYVKTLTILKTKINKTHIIIVVQSVLNLFFACF